jgi:D-glycero-D-manno-heptose 1,7-bisphosphate phosphatase
MTHNRAIFLDRDGVLVEDVDLLTDVAHIRVLEGAPQALRRLKEAGFVLLVVTNQPLIARGLATEAEVDRINAAIGQRLVHAGAPAIDRFYVCPHHPKANLPAYRGDCPCRKPRPGLILKGANDYAVDLAASFIVGDRITDVVAGVKAGCRTVLVQTGKHLDPPIQTAEPLDQTITPNWTCANLAEAAEWILTRP